MKKFSLCIWSIALAVVIALSPAAAAAAYTPGAPYQKDLHAWIQNDQRAFPQAVKQDACDDAGHDPVGHSFPPRKNRAASTPAVTDTALDSHTAGRMS